MVVLGYPRKVCRIDGLPIDDFSRAKMTATANELSEELALALSLL